MRSFWVLFTDSTKELLDDVVDDVTEKNNEDDQIVQTVGQTLKQAANSLHFLCAVRAIVGVVPLVYRTVAACVQFCKDYGRRLCG